MQFQLTPKQEMIKRAVREFAENEIRPVAAECDENQEMPEHVLRKMAELKYFGLPVSRKYGGAGLERDTVAFCVATEEIGRVDASASITVGVHGSVVAAPLHEYGTEDQKERFLRALATGEKVGAFTVTEPNAGSDANRVETRAVEDGDEYVLNGTKIFATNGGIAEIFLVVAATGRKGSRQDLTIFIVERDAPGFQLGKKENKLGVRASATNEILLQDVRVPRENVLGTVGGGMGLAMRILDYGRILMAAQCVGLGQACLEAMLRYSNEREQFGSKLGRFQMVQAKIADAATEVEAARLLTYQAADLRDRGMPYAVKSSMAKLFASEAAMRAAHSAVQVHGGYGLMKGFPVERYFRDAKMAEIYEGTSEIQRMVIASRLLRSVGP
ncbi:MAG: acyl-CoA dehydrogenase AcdA [Promethearchaeota archaeon]